MALIDFNEPGNAWNSVVTGASGVSNVINLHSRPNVTIIGSVSGATTLTVEASIDQSNWYATSALIYLVASGDFDRQLPGFGVPYLRLRSSLSVTATISVCAWG